ncbi:MAG: aminotransferase class IV [Bdellovibrionaceae bacterium]|nr:aminotransferase class IV [Pseudobdellovibrionaceae bacterium]
MTKTHLGQSNYWAMYSSWFGRVVTDPNWMLVPIDDHLVHRGDGVFEALKWTGERVYLFDQHLSRLRQSAARIALPLDWTDEEIKELVERCLVEGRLQHPSEIEAMIRIFVSRGPGNFSANPYDSVGPQLYIVVTRFQPVSSEKRKVGVSLGRSGVMGKPQDWAPYKTCNYLPNVMVKKEAVDRGVDFMVGFDSRGFMTESSTENVVIVSQRNELLKPKKGLILQGTTMNRVFELARPLVEKGILDRIQEEDITQEMVMGAKEVMILGTTWDVLPVTIFDGKKIGKGVPGLITCKLQELLLADQSKKS